MGEFEEKGTPIQPEQEQQEALDIAKIVDDLKAQGLADEQIKQALIQMKEEGKIAEEDLAKALELLGGAGVAADGEKAEAEKLFDMKLV